MPIHDWTRVKAGIFHAFHHFWIAEISQALNRGLLPPEYYALPEQVTAGLGPDVLTLQRLNGPPAARRPKAGRGSSGGTALRTAPPKARFHISDELKWYAQKKKAVVIRHVSEDRPVAVIEIVSPGNKDSFASLAGFVTKTRELLSAGIHVSLVDLFPPTRRDPHGIHAAAWGEGDPFQFDPAQPLTCAAYVAGEVPQAYVEPVAVGAPLPDLPVFLTPTEYVDAPLESTYHAAFHALPEPTRGILEQSSPRPRRRRPRST